MKLPKTVFWLGVVSLATDASSDLIYPLLPAFLASIGAGPAFLGVIEGTAEAVSSLLKLVSGRLADRGARKPLVLGGYALSSLTRPLMAFAWNGWAALGVRLLDRVGKGLRSSPRDALLGDATTPDQRGRAFGFHRAMDNAGAVIGPLIGMGLVALGVSLKNIFLLAAAPAAIAVVTIVFAVKETPREPKPVAHTGEEPRAQLPPRSYGYFLALALFSLGNASDAFLLLRAQKLGVTIALIPALWLTHNAVKALLGTTGGALSDRLGRKRLIVAGWALYALVYLGFGQASEAWHIWGLFVAYGLYYALVEGGERALVADLVPAAARGRAFGAYYAVVGLAALPASLGFGLVVEKIGPRTAFGISAALAGAGALALAIFVPEPKRNRL
jgi:MFS family permease